MRVGGCGNLAFGVAASQGSHSHNFRPFIEADSPSIILSLITMAFPIFKMHSSCSPSINESYSVCIFVIDMGRYVTKTAIEEDSISFRCS
jgi:hypothetical protein